MFQIYLFDIFKTNCMQKKVVIIYFFIFIFFKLTQNASLIKKSFTQVDMFLNINPNEYLKRMLKKH